MNRSFLVVIAHLDRAVVKREVRAMHRTLTMKLIGLVLAATLGAGCFVETQTARFEAITVPRTGHVDSVQEIDTHIDGQPLAGAAAGAVLGSVFAGGDGALIGAGIGAVASSGSSTTREFRITVDFDDGERRVFLLHDYSPFAPGDHVILDSRGLEPLYATSSPAESPAVQAR